MTDVLQLPVHIQIALAGGYMGYVTAYAGLRSGHGTRDMLLLTLVFGAFPALAWPFLADRFEDGFRFIAGIAALALPVVMGALWRRSGRLRWYGLLHRLGVHVDDGLSGGWESLTQHPGVHVRQLMVRTSDGVEHYCSNIHEHVKDQNPDGVLRTFCPFFGSDGSVVMVVDEEEDEDGTTTKRTQPVDDEWGVRLTYLPADRIERVEMRVIDV